MRHKVVSCLVALLVVASIVPMGFVGSVGAAATTNTHEFTGSPEIVVVNTTDNTGSMTVEWHADGRTLEKSTYDANNTDGVALANLGAYDSVNATVTVEGNVTTEQYGGRLSLPDKYVLVGGTGGDADVTCDVGERIAKMVDDGFTQLDCVAQPGAYAVNTTTTDLSQTKLDIYQAGVNQEAVEDNANTTLSNYLTDASTIAKIKAKNTYIRELNNGSSESAALTAANQTVQDYYSVKQENLINRWNTAVDNFEYQDNVSESEGASTHYVDVMAEDPDGGTPDYMQYDSSNSYAADVLSYGTTSVTLANGSTVEATTVDIEVRYEGSTPQSNTYTITPLTGTIINATSYSSYTNDNQETDLRRLVVQDSLPEAEGEANMVVFEDYKTQFDRVDAQSADVKSQMAIVVNNTYDAYQDGEINNSDLLDSHTLAAEYSPGSQYESWAAAQLTLLGQNNPDAMESIGFMNVTDETTGNSYSGVLMSAENPSSGEFKVNNTYDAAAIGGTQYIVTDGQIHELTGNFTLTAAQTHDGEQVQNVTIYEKQYSTSNVSELKALYDDLAKTRAEIEAREDNLRSSTGGGALFGSNQSIVLVMVAAGAVYLLGREDKGN